jgi:hypothetical protein
MEQNQVGFMLQRIVTNQFAIIEKSFKENHEIELHSEINYGFNEQYRVIGCTCHFELTINRIPFIIIKVTCEFQIEENNWNNFIDKEKNVINFPEGFLSHLAVITIGTTRGILHAKTENTRFNQYFLPTINLTDFVKNNISFPLNVQNP